MKGEVGMNNVRKLRISKGIQQKELAIIIGVKQPTVSEWELNKKDPSGERLLKLAEYFGVDIDEIVMPGGKDRSQTEQIVQYVLDKLGATNTQDEYNIKTPEARLIAKGIDKMPKDKREQAVNVIRAVFAQNADYFKEGDKTDVNA